MDARGVAGLGTTEELVAVASGHNWDDGFAVPLAVANHPACDRGLALMLFWELDECAELFWSDADSEFLDPDDADEAAYVRRVTGGLLEDAFPSGSTVFDTGFLGAHLHPEGSRPALLRAGRTRLKVAEGYPEQLLRPELGDGA
ncbi:MAG TPA: DUF4274 domain-containing protein [Nocardioides sp.]